MNRLLQILQGHTISIVGNAPVDVDMSKEIDSSDVVVRFNHFYNYKSGNVGKRVDVVLQTVSSAWFDAYRENGANSDVVKAQKPAIFLVKRPDNYKTDTHMVYGNDIRVDNLAHLFEPWWKFTTGTAALCYLAENLVNAKVRCYGFATEENGEEKWKTYLNTDAKHYKSVQNEERPAMLDAIKKLESLEIDGSGWSGEIPKTVVVPVKAKSTGAPGKNKQLLPILIEKLKNGCKYPVTVVGDDYDLLHMASEAGFDTCSVSTIAAYADVTDTLRDWRVKSGYCGDVALVQCTSPNLKVGWIDQCFDALKYAPVSATVCNLNFKVSAIFREERGVFVPVSNMLPPASVARQLLPRAVRITGAVEAFHTDALDKHSLYDAGVLKPVFVEESDSLDVDTQEDLQKVNTISNNQTKNQT